MLRLLYISQIADPALHDLSVYVGQSDGDDDVGWFQARLAEVRCDKLVDLTSARVCIGDALPPAAAVDAAVIGGSYHMVGEQRGWQRRIHAFLDAASQSRIPVLGICGGHQLMSAHLGADVGPLDAPPCAGTMLVPRSEPGRAHWLFEDIDESVPFHFCNDEHVRSVPAGARVLACDAQCPALALDYGDDWVSTQFHPEMSTEGFVRYWADIDPARAASYRESPRAALVIRNFVHRALARRAQNTRVAAERLAERA